MSSDRAGLQSRTQKVLNMAASAVLGGLVVEFFGWVNLFLMIGLVAGFNEFIKRRDADAR